MMARIERIAMWGLMALMAWDMWYMPRSVVIGVCGG